jgi:hypothetical protein
MAKSTLCFSTDTLTPPAPLLLTIKQLRTAYINSLTEYERGHTE